MLTIITSLKSTLSVKRKDLYPYSDTEAVRKAESVKVAWSGMWQRSVCVSIVSSMDCESCFFCPFSTKEKFGANFQPLSFSASKAVPQQFFLLHEAKLSQSFFCYMKRNFFCHLTALSTGHHIIMHMDTHFLLSSFLWPSSPPAVLPLHRYIWIHTLTRHDR